VLLAMGIGPQEALGSLRLTVGKHTPPDAVDRAVEVIRASVEQLNNGNLTPARAC
jgi:cysteine sulfinate desulfinase/cysteine desulfurase-like protein